jgi:SAM-dependent methyltransferase
VATVSAQVVGKIKRVVPVPVKRAIARRLPARFWHDVDPDWHRKAVGGLWDAVGELQFDLLVREGLEPHHRLLDIGCGSLRGGVHFIRYLDAGNYTGIDKSTDRLAAGRDVELPAAGLEAKRSVLEVVDDFDFTRLGTTFDYAIAQSLFTHLPLELIRTCLLNVDGVLAPGASLYATFLELESDDQNRSIDRSERLYAKDPNFWFAFDELEAACEGTALEPRYAGDWGHPRDQKLAVFTRR